MATSGYVSCSTPWKRCPGNSGPDALEHTLEGDVQLVTADHVTCGILSRGVQVVTVNHVSSSTPRRRVGVSRW